MSRYRDIDDDDDPRMESSFAQQQREEYISKKLGMLYNFYPLLAFVYGCARVITISPCRMSVFKNHSVLFPILTKIGAAV